MVKRIILMIIILIMIFCILIFVYVKWKYPHGWEFSVIKYTSGNSVVIDSFIVIDSNFKLAELRADEYVRRQTKYPLDVEVEIVKEIGRTPWKRYGIYTCSVTGNDLKKQRRIGE